MDKTKLEHDLETAETRSKLNFTTILLLLICIAIIISLFLMMTMRSTLSIHEEQINNLEKRVTSLQDDLMKKETDTDGAHK
jgi:F0F1-type ATP synthase membrane subunit a